ncbi:hypothetical protein JCM10207_002654 [Rhodosporidiobolus poonsookiae]
MRAALALLAALTPCATLAQRILAINDPASSSATFDTFWRSLQDRGFDLTVRDVQEAGRLLEDRSTSFDHLILFAPAGKQPPRALSPQALSRRLDDGSDLLLVVSPDSAELWRDFAREFEVDPDDRGQVVVDHFAFDAARDDGAHTTLTVPVSSVPAPFVSEATRKGPAVLYRGSGHYAGRQPLLTNLLHASSSAFSGDADSSAPPEDARLAGSSIGLVSAFQARNNARVVLAGSVDLFSDAFMTSETGNEGFASDLAAWNFKKTGIVRVEESKHVFAETGEPVPMYRVKSDLTYTVKLSISDSVSLPDLQVEFGMLDPHLRVALPAISSEGNTTTYQTTFRVPDRHGVFTLRLDYRRPGWSFIDEKNTVSVVPPNHNEYDRFITGAAPYYLGAASVSTAFVLFVSLWMLQS